MLRFFVASLSITLFLLLGFSPAADKTDGPLAMLTAAGKPAPALQHLADGIRRVIEPLAAVRPRAAAIDPFVHLVRKASWTIDDVVFAFARKPDDKLVSIGPLSMTFTFGSSDPARWVEVFSPDKDCTVRNLSLHNVTYR